MDNSIKYNQAEGIRYEKNISTIEDLQETPVWFPVEKPFKEWQKGLARPQAQRTQTSNASINRF